MEIFCYFLNFQPFIDGSCLNRLFWRLPNGDFSIPMILIKDRGWLSISGCLFFLRGGGRHTIGTMSGSGKRCLNFLPASQNWNDSLTLYPTRKSCVLKAFQRTAWSLQVFFSTRCLPGVVVALGAPVGQREAHSSGQSAQEEGAQHYQMHTSWHSDTVSAFYFSSIGPFLLYSRRWAKSWLC